MPCASAARSLPTRSRTADRASRDGPCPSASQRLELLSEREILEHQFLVPAKGQRHRPRDQRNHFHDTGVVSWAPCEINRHGFRGEFQIGVPNAPTAPPAMHLTFESRARQVHAHAASGV